MRKINLMLAVILSILLLGGYIFAQDTTLTITEEGKIGIGITNPTSQLHLYGASDGPSGLTIESLFGDQTFFYYTGENGLVIDSWRPADARRLSLLFQPQGGNVGIGTYFPSEKLEIGNGSLKVTNSGPSNALAYRPFVLLNHVGQPDEGSLDFGGGIIWQKDAVNQFEMFYANFDSSLYFWNSNLGPQFIMHNSGNMWANGMIESGNGGFKFPDGTVQTTAAEGSATGDGHSLDAADGDPTDVVFVDNNGLVGLGTTTPAWQLDMQSGSGVGTGIAMGNSSEGGREWLVLSAGQDNTEGAGNFSIINEFGPHMTIDGSGNMGLGTTTPAWQLDMQSGSGVGTGFVMGNSSAGGREWLVLSAGQDNTEGAGNFSIINEFGPHMTIDGSGNMGLGTTIPRAKLSVSGITFIHGNKSNDFGSSFAPTIDLAIDDNDTGFEVPDDGTLAIIGNNQERVRIDILGRVGIGTDNPVHPLEMASGAHVTSGGVWTNASSRALKENISEINADEALSVLSELNPVKYNYLSEPGEEYLGFIAEDVPDMVAQNNRKSLSPMDVVALLTKVVQEQQKKIAELEDRLNSDQ